MADMPATSHPGKNLVVIASTSFPDQTMVAPPSLEPHQDSMSPTRDVTAKGKQIVADVISESQQNRDARSSRKRMTTNLMSQSPHLSSRQNEAAMAFQERDQETDQKTDQETDILSATMAIDAYTCAFDISKDDYFLWEVQNVMKSIENKDPKVKDDLTAVYKYAYTRSQVNDDLAQEVLSGMKKHFESTKPNKRPVRSAYIAIRELLTWCRLHGPF